MGREDIDVSLEMRRILSDKGIKILVEAELLRVQGRSGEKVSLGVRTTSGEQKIEGSDILVAVGRVPNTTGIGLEATGVELDARGYIRVNERLETTAAKVWAIGECAGSPQFTHISEDDFRGSFETIWAEAIPGSADLPMHSTAGAWTGPAALQATHEAGASAALLRRKRFCRTNGASASAHRHAREFLRASTPRHTKAAANTAALM
jgi:pyruvate/2-oxoglutarate dehydrogenase complex dihydrolipoamide dehydrogenase (E3) component